MDNAGKLDERVATALELWQGPDRDRPYATAVYRQATDAVEKTGWRRWRLRTRGARTGWTLALVLLVCGVLCAAQEFGRQSDEAQRLADDIARLSPTDRQKIAEIARAAETAHPDQREQLQKIETWVVLPPDQKELEKAIAELEKRGIHFTSVLPQDIKDKLAAMDKSEGKGGHAIGTGDPNAHVTPLPERPDKTGPGRVLVYGAKIRDVLDSRPAANGAVAGGPAVVGESVDSDQAWKIAGERAAGALQSGDVPPQYRDIMRNFFEPGKN
jgi:hypothetical protein